MFSLISLYFFTFLEKYICQKTKAPDYVKTKKHAEIKPSAASLVPHHTWLGDRPAANKN